MANLNANSHFAQLPKANIRRSRFKMDHTHKTTFNAGLLVPNFVKEVLPGDSFTVDTSMLVRMQTLITPLMDDMYLDQYFFFVPNRLVWNNWQRFCGESDEPWYDDTVYSVPQINVNVGDRSTKLSVGSGTVADYLGMPLAPSTGVAPKVDSFNHLPFRAYCRIWNEWFRDENLQNMTAFNTEDTSVDMDNSGSAFYGGALLPVSKYRDYFTSALPEPQKGPEVTIGIGQTAPVFTAGVNNTFDQLSQGYDAIQPMRFVDRTDGSTLNDNWYQMYARPDNTVAGYPGTTPTTPGNRVGIVPANLVADISAATGISINELRMAFATQQFYEANARAGSRYIEILNSMFGVTSPDSRLQRTEFLGGNRVAINVSQVVQNSETNNTPLGDLGAYSLTTDHQNSFTHSFVEHGILMGVCCVRYKHSYQNGFHKSWLRKDKFDYYWPIFSNIGEQPIINKQLYADGSDSDNEVFGYQEAWADYRYADNRVSGEFRSDIDNTLDWWHLADDYSSRPYLSSDWIVENGDTVDRAIAVSQRVSNQFMADFYFDITATRPMPIYSIPGLTKL